MANLRSEIGTILRRLSEYKGVEVLEGKTCIDHVHICMSIPLKYLVSTIVGYLKDSSSDNPEDNVIPSDQRSPCKNNEFDIVFMSSVFTHMTPPGLRNYICEIYSVLKPNGILMCAFHLTKDLSQLVTNYVDVRPDSMDSKYYKVADVNIPEINVAYDENYILNLFKNANLSLIGTPYFGKWNNRENHLSWQD